AGSEDHRSLDGVAQLAHVAWPGILQQRAFGFRRQLQRRPARRPREEDKETAREGEDLVAATMRTSAARVRVSPTRSNCLSCRKRNSLAWIADGISPTSSRNNVPPS